MRFCYLSVNFGQATKLNTSARHDTHGRIQGGHEVRTYLLEIHKCLYVSLENLGRTTLEKQLEPSGPIASRGWSLRPSVKYVDDLTNVVRNTPPP